MSNHEQPPASFVHVSPESHFPIQNLPFGVFRPRAQGEPRIGVAIGEEILDLSVLERRGLLDVPAIRGLPGSLFDRAALNRFMALGREACRQVRTRIAGLLAADEPTLRDDGPLRREEL